ncbi:DUF5723 family protein [Maribacter sp. 2308TA10-17]|uniref:DUF5723 family protein n=1 Tax=Maribacter sp. 2308TA10-17 TaxID=3386276 RepID=UPI0039BC4A23
MRIPKIFYFIILLWTCFGAQAQNKQVLYDFSEIPQSLMINPGVQSDFKWYAGIPGISGLSFQIGSSGVSAYDLFAADGIDFNTKFRNRLIGGMTRRDELSGTYQLELLNVGFRSQDPNVFYSFGIYNEGDAIGYWFEDYAILAIEGNADRLNQRFDLGDLKTRGEMMNVFHFGVNKKIDNKFTVGARGKIYSSIFDFNSTRNKGFFVTRPGQNNLLSSTINADMKWRTSGINALKNAASDDEIPSTILKRGFFGGNLGLGIDLGFTYQINKQTVFTASLLDLGFIYHSNDVENYTLKGDVTTEGVEVILPGDILDPSRDFWQDLVDDIEEILPFENNFKNYITFRPTKLNASLRYNWGEQSLRAADCDCGPNVNRSNRAQKFVNGVGGQLYVINRPRGPQTALTAFYQRRFGNVLAVKATYTADKFTYTNVGFGMNLQAGPVNLYVIADNLLAYRNIADSQYASFQLGLNIISWGKK